MKKGNVILSENIMEFTVTENQDNDIITIKLSNRKIRL